MKVAIPSEFERFAREQVRAGLVASEEEVVARVLRDCLARIEDIRALVDPAVAEVARGEVADGERFMGDLIAGVRQQFDE